MAYLKSERKRPPEAEIKFDVYQKYLASIKALILKEYPQPRMLLKSAMAQEWGNQISGVDEGILKRFLYIGWNTEFLLTRNDTEDVELIKIGNHWKPIQSYYAVYSVGEALAYLIDLQSPEKHSECLSKLNRLFVEQVKINPWSMAFTGNKRGGLSPLNFPGNVEPHQVMTQRDIEPIRMIMACIQAERNNIIKEWSRPNFTKKAKESGNTRKLKVDYNPPFTTLLNFLYRLRIKSNYKDVEIFISGTSEDQIRNFSDNMTFFVFHTLILFESLIMKRMGVNKFLVIAKDFEERFGGRENKLSERLEMYAAAKRN